MGSKPRRILIVYEHPNSVPCRETMRSHLKVFEASSTEHQIEYFNCRDVLPPDWARRKVTLSQPAEIQGRSFDVVIFHYSLLGMRTLGQTFFHWKQIFRWLADLPGLKIAIPQDEGDYASLLDEWLDELGVSIIFSVHYRPEGPLYPMMRHNASIYPCLPGYIDEMHAQRISESLVPMADRPMDIVYRARNLSFRYGSAGRQKASLAEAILKCAAQQDFAIDISTCPADTITGKHWFNFLASARVVPDAEGGYSAIDWRGELRSQCNALLREEQELSFEKFCGLLPDDWDNYQLRTITPRHFEAIITKSCQVLVEGDYKGVLRPHEHYLLLRKDFSNLTEVLDTIRNYGYLQEIADRAYEEIYRSNAYTYTTWAHHLETVIEEHEVSDQTKDLLMSESDTDKSAVDALERQLIAARQENARIQASLHEMVGEISDQVVSRVMQEFRCAIIRRLPLLVVGLIVTIMVIGILIFATH